MAKREEKVWAWFFEAKEGVWVPTWHQYASRADALDDDTGKPCSGAFLGRVTIVYDDERPVRKRPSTKKARGKK